MEKVYISDAAMAAQPRLRPADRHDVEAIAALWHRGWGDGHLGHVPDQLLAHRRLADFRRRVPSRLATTTIAETGGHLVGFVTVRNDEIEQLYVDAHARGSGVAAALLGHGERVIAEQHERAWLAVVAGNTRARRFYARYGWIDTGPFDNPAEIAGGTMTVPTLRYEKRLRPANP
jgi:ribosomal protein S18 acetylase RimI-like enzyme